MAEFDLIERIAARCAQRADVVLGIGDDCALLQPPPGHWLALSCDTLNAGVHFRADDPPSAVGHKAAAVNLSDLAAMGAAPAWCTLALSLPQPDSAWLDGFLDGFLGLGAAHGLALVGGDTTRGPLAIAVTVHGLLPAGTGLRRSGAQAGDDLWVTGSLGDAAAGLAGLGHADAAAFLRERLQRPTPRVAAGGALRDLAHAAIDVSDGLLADLGHVLRASALGAEIELAALPTSPALRAAVVDDQVRWTLQTSGGDDYELLFAAAPAQRDAIAAALAAVATPATRIGRVQIGAGCRLIAADGRTWAPARTGYQHFAEGA